MTSPQARSAGLIDRVLLVVLDGLGVGALPAASPPHLRSAHSLRNVSARAYPPRIPFLSSLGLLAAADLDATPPARCWGWGRARQLSSFNESYAAHWEMAGHVAWEGRGHPDGLPAEMVSRVEEALGTPVVGNVGCYPRLAEVPAAVLEAHLATGRPILLTQAEEEPVSVIGVYCCPAARPAETLFAMIVRAIPRLADAPVPGRLCGRIFDIDQGRPEVRRDRLDLPYFTPPSTTLLDAITRSGRSARATGKVGGLFAGQGFTECDNDWGDERILAATLDAWAATSAGLVWANFNALSRPAGAARDWIGWARAIELYDSYLERLHDQMGPGDVLIVTGDHGVDPTLTGEHTFEWTPLLVAGPGGSCVPLGSRRLVDIAATIAAWWELRVPSTGQSFAAVLGGSQTLEGSHLVR